MQNSAVIGLRGGTFMPQVPGPGTRAWALLLVLFLAAVAAQGQAVNDLRSRQSGNWSDRNTWERWNGSAWVLLAADLTASGAAASAPSVTVRNGHTVFLNDTPFSVRDLVVDAGGRLWAGAGPNRYITIYGSTLRCDGEIGSGPTTFDQISFNIDGANVSLEGAGSFNASRLRKNFNVNATTNFTISMDVNLLFNTASSAQIYNNFVGTSNFNVIIAGGVTVNLTGGGNASMDGVDGLGNGSRGGSYTVNGTFNVSGTIFMTTDNTAVAQQVRFTVNNGGVVRAARANVTNSAAAGHVLTLNAGSTLELTGAGAAWAGFDPLSTTNQYVIDAASTIIYSANGVQNVVNHPPLASGYGNLTIRGNGFKQLSANTVVRGNLFILDTDGSPVLDVMPENWQLTVGGDWVSYGEAGFAEQQGLVLFNGGLAQQVNTVGGEQFYNWRIAKTGTFYVTMASPVAVVNNLGLPGTNSRLDLGGHELHILNGAGSAISVTPSAARHIRAENVSNSSRVRWDIGSVLGNHRIPFGTNAGVRTFNFNLTSGNAGQVTVSTYGTGSDNLPWPVSPTVVNNLQSTIGLSPDNRDATVDRFWQVDVTGTPTAALTFTYIGAELPPSPYNAPLAMHAQRYNGATNTWEDPIELQTAAGTSVTVPGVTQFGPWTISSVLSPLPIELLSFTAVARDQVVDLQWVTATERDNAFFTILRSADARQFVELFRLAGEVDSRIRKDYHAVDDAPLAGVSYYRLRQTDLDGTSTESAVVAVHRQMPGRELVVYPNPAEDHVLLDGLGMEEAVLRVLDLSGRTVWSGYKALGDGPYRIPMEAMAAGLYHIQVEQAGALRTARVLRR